MLSLKDSLAVLRKTKALLEGHFVLSSGLHSNQYIQCAKLLSFPKLSSKFSLSLSNKIKKNIKNIDLLKIDTEGYELEVLKGAQNILHKTKYILFEHHYDDMIVKNYFFSDIHEFLRMNNFTKLFKSKMPFRKTFEYIYENKSF